MSHMGHGGNLHTIGDNEQVVSHMGHGGNLHTIGTMSKSCSLWQITLLNSSAHRNMPICLGGTHAQTRGMIPLCTPVFSQGIYYTYKTNVQKENINKVISGYMPFSPQAPHTLPVGFLAPCSRLPGCAGCTSSPTCSVWWCAGDGPTL